MNGKKAKALRKKVYKDDATKVEKYFRPGASITLMADNKRRQYQAEKKVRTDKDRDNLKIKVI